MSAIPSLSKTQTTLWKRGLRALIKSSGHSQQEVAIEMARIVAIRERKIIVAAAFTASLSRFINAKDSAYPGWLLHEEERLLPFSEALGLESTKEIWDILWRITGEEVKEVTNDHSGFPDIDLVVAPRFQFPLEQIFEDLDSEKQIYIIGKAKEGKKFAAQWLREKVQRELGFFPKISCLETQTQSNPDSMDLLLEPWNTSDVQDLITQLLTSKKLSTSEELNLSEYAKILNTEWLGFDRRPDSILWQLADIARLGVSKNHGAEIRRRNAQFWLRIQQNETISSFSLQAWQNVLYVVWISGSSIGSSMDSSIGKTVFLQQLEKLQPEVFELSREGLAAQVERLRSRSKSIREEAIRYLEKQIHQCNVKELFEALEAVGLIAEVQGAVVCKDFQYALPMLAEYLCNRPAPVLPEPAFLCSQNWWKMLWVMCQLKISYTQLQSFLSNHGKWTEIDCARSVIFWTMSSVDAPPKEILVQSWAIAVWAELQAIVPVKLPFSPRFSELLLEISFQYAAVLPEIEQVEQLSIIFPEMDSLFPKKEFIQYRDLQGLCPVQHAPKSIAEWKKWTDATLAWKALVAKAELGSVASILLLSEGEGSNDPVWKWVPFAIRLQWLGVGKLTSTTLYAFQLLLVEAWDPNSAETELFLQTAERIGFVAVLEWMRQWCSPLFIGQYFHSEQNITRMLSQATLDFCIHFQAYSLLENWLDEVWNWCLSSNQIKGNFISWQNKRVFVSDIASNQKELLQQLAEIIFNGAKALYSQERPYLLYRLYFEGEQVEQKINSNWVKKDSHQFLLQEGDITLIQEWIDIAPKSDSLMERYLLQDVQKLSKAWRQDKKVMRRLEILRIAALQKPIPKWALSVANKQITRKFLWPHWLSPYGSDVIFLVRQMIIESSGRNQLWWLRVFHRSEPWPPELVQGLQEWTAEPDALDWSSRTVHALSTQSSPWLDAFDMLNLLKEYQLFEPNAAWLLEAAENLWKNCQIVAESSLSRILFSFFEALEDVAFLFQGDWMVEKEGFLDVLCPIWFESQEAEFLEEYVDHSVIGGRVERFLKIEGNERALQQAAKIFLQGEINRLVDIIRLDNFDGLIAQFSMRFPEKNRALVQELQKIPFVWKEESGRLQAWLRKLEF